MPLLALPAVFMRGGTSRAVMFHQRDLPDRTAWDPIFLAAMGSPDPNGRQLDGMGGGVSSLSKICVLAPSARDDADIDYTFAQVQIREAAVDYRGNCGNMSSAVGPFAVDEGLLHPNGDSATVRIFNTNTSRIIRAHFPLADGRAATEGPLAIPGVAGTGAPVRLDFLDPGGATTGRLLPTGRVVDRLHVTGHGPIEASLVDAANACVFVRAADLGLRGDELPDELEANRPVLDLLQRVRRAASVAMGIAADEEEAGKINGVPFVSFVAPARDAATLSGELLRADDVDLTARFISSGQPHRALPLTGSLCTAVAARIEGTIVSQMLAGEAFGAIRLGMPSGILTVDADVGQDATGQWLARSGAFYRTARRLFDGRIYVPRPPGLVGAAP
jgi:2-methylaconitate cis-trans-isomerase PrpF